MSSNITISSTTQTILFKSISGELENTSSSITITLTGGGVSKSIIINKKGILSKSPTAEEIAAAIPPLTVTSCTYADKKISIDYTAGQVGYNYASQTINSTGVTGLTATLLGDGPIATGGDTVTDITVGTDTYRVHTFTTVGTSSLNVIQGGEFEYLVVAGGGGGGMDMGGGGGGGGVLTGNLSLTPQLYNLTVGVGGTGAPSAGTNGQPSGHQYTIPATSGGNSSFASLTAIGGGRGGSSYRGYTPGIAGGNGGSGGGAGGYNDNAGTFLGGTGVTGQGFSGGNSINAYYSGGGGGAGGAGIGSNNQPNGGPGILSNILGTPYYWAGGGGGSGYSGIGGNGGIGGGGGGAVGTTTGGVGINNGSPGGGGSINSWANTPGGNAGANTGGGGGGGSHYNANNKGGNGGSGIVVVRYKLATGGTLASTGTLQYEVTGTPSGAGTANFNLSNIGNMGVGCNNSNIAVKILDIVKDGLVLHLDAGNPASYPGTGTTWFDLSGNNNNGTLVNGVGYSSANGGSLVFDGVNDYASISHSSSLNFSTALTISVWYYSGDVRGWLYLKGRTDVDNYNPLAYSSGRYGWTGPNGRSFYEPPSGFIQPNNWYNLTFSHISGNNPIIYRNAVASTSHTYSEGNGTRTLGTNSNPVGVNADIPRGTIETFNGRIALLQVYNRALTESEIQQNFNATRGRFGL
jgi:hypothetical protein